MVIENISYDKELAANVSADYLPDIDVTMKTGKGICFDYASLMAAAAALPGSSNQAGGRIFRRSLSCLDQRLP